MSSASFADGFGPIPRSRRHRTTLRSASGTAACAGIHVQITSTETWPDDAGHAERLEAEARAYPMAEALII